MVRGQLPADDAAAVGIQHEGQIGDALPRAQVGQIGDPQGVRPIGDEVALHEIARPRRGQRRAGSCASAWSGAWRLRCRAGASAAARGRGPPAGRRGAAPARRGGSRRRTSCGRAARGSASTQLLVVDAAPRAPRRCAASERAGARRPGPADRLDTEALAMLVDERAHFGRSASSSVAKNTLAAFEDLIRPAQLGVLPPQPLDLLPLRRRRQVRPQPLVGLHLPHVPAQRLRRRSPDPGPPARSADPTRSPPWQPAPTAPAGTSSALHASPGPPCPKASGCQPNRVNSKPPPTARYCCAAPALARRQQSLRSIDKPLRSFVAAGQGSLSMKVRRGSRGGCGCSSLYRTLGGGDQA